jgi:C-terminal processing protease CtpA/Prc
MFDEAFKKAEESVTRMNKTLTLFEKECENLRDKFFEDLKGFQEKTNSLLVVYKNDIEKIYADYDKRMLDVFSEYKNKLSVLTTADLEFFSADVRKRFEGLYTEYEQEAQKKILKVFETDIKGIFDKYGDQLAPIIFKSLLRYIFRIKRK